MKNVIFLEIMYTKEGNYDNILFEYKRKKIVLTFAVLVFYFLSDQFYA